MRRPSLRSIAVVFALLAAILPPGARALAGPPGATIHIRWQQSVTESDRQNLEVRLHLMDGEWIDEDTWRYDLVDPSPDNIRALLLEPAVGDTQGIDRPSNALDPAAGRTARRQRFPNHGDRLVAVGDLLAMALAAVVVSLALAGMARRMPITWALWRRVQPTMFQPLLDAPASLAGTPHSKGRPRLWTSVVMLATAPFLLTLCLTLWHSPFPMTEGVALLEDVEALPISHFFSPDTAYFRPMFHIMLSALWHNIDDLDTRLALVKLATIVPILILVTLFIWYLRPRTALDAAATSLAVAVLVGSSGFRDNLEIGLNYTIVGMAISLLVWIALNHERRIWHAPLILALTLVAIGFKEQGLVIVPIVVVAWWMGAPGASRGMAATLAIIAVAYVGIRLSGGTSWELFQQDVGFGFTEIDKYTAAARFGAFPYWMYAYNSASTLANILVAEPTRGTFRIVRAAFDGDLRLWHLLHVGSSVGTTSLIAWWGVRSVRSTPRGLWSPQSQLFVASVFAVLACSALSFNYSRDRLGGMAVVFYALATCFAVREAAARTLAASRARLIIAGLGLTLLAAAWQTRTVATLEYARLHSWGNQEDWFIRLPVRRIDFGHRGAYMNIMESMVEQGTAPEAPRPTRLPDWVVHTIGRP